MIPNIATDEKLLARLRSAAAANTAPIIPEDRQRAYLQAWVAETLLLDRPRLSMKITKSLNAHSVGNTRRTGGGRVRKCELITTNRGPCGDIFVQRSAPNRFIVQRFMEMMIEDLDREWEVHDPVLLATFTLWRINFIHPYLDGNGRTARAASYLVLCLKLGAWLPGESILPDLLTQNRREYVGAVTAAHGRVWKGPTDLLPLHSLMCRLLAEQLDRAN